MNGITACFTGRLGKDAEIRTTRDGKPWAAFPVAVDTDVDSEAGTAWVRVALFGDTVDALAPRLTKAAQVYVGGPVDPAPVDGCGWEGEGGAQPHSLVSTAHGPDRAAEAQAPITR